MTTSHIPNDLGHFTGGGETHRWSVLTPMRMSEGVKYLVESAECFWLLDIIASYQSNRKMRATCGHIQFWHLVKKGERGAEVYVQADSDQPKLITQSIEFTDFPFTAEHKDIQLWVSEEGLIFLPSEY
jgi:hypothetical protein